MPSSIIGWISADEHQYLLAPPSHLVLGQAVPEDLWNSHGLLLLARGQLIQSPAQLAVLEELPALVLAQPTSVDMQGAMRAQPTADAEPAQLWRALHASLDGLLASGPHRREFGRHLDRVVAVATHLLDSQPERSLFMLVQMLAQGEFGYCAANGLACAAICHRLAPELSLPGRTRTALFRAALTMNIGMSVLQDQLALQTGPLTEAQRLEVANHPQRGVDLLKSLGVTDIDWLQIVFDHQEPPPGGPAELLQTADVCVARMSPRRSRRALSPIDALRRFYADRSHQPSPIARLLVQHIGIHPPGSYVRLASNETAVVTGFSRAYEPPPVLALADRNNSLLDPPLPRDAGDIRYRIRESIPPDEVPAGCLAGSALLAYF
jgi:hypothetical protein